MKNTFVRLLLLVSITLLVSGCPRFAIVDIYNNSGVEIEINVGTGVVKVPAGTSKALKLTSEKISVRTETEIWMYDRAIIPYNGENGPFFDGTIYVQLEPSGKLLAVPKGTERPIANAEAQPPGYPIEPN